MTLELRALTAGYPGRRGRPPRRVLTGLDVAASPGELTVLAGPNGTGKSTLLRTLAGLQPALDGRVLLDGADLTAIGPADLARRLAVVLTERDLPPLLTARELAGLGRHPHTGLTGRLTAADRAVVDWALAAVNASHLADRQVTELSDGERQRVLTARALAQEPSAILLDEPTAFLDVPSRVALMGLLRELSRSRSLIVLVSTHDLELALRIADRIWLLTGTGGLRCGTPEQLALDGSIASVFDGGGLAFDAAAGVFVLPAGTAGTVRVDAGPGHTPVVERGLTRQGWRVTGSTADLAVTRDDGGYTAAFDGTRHRFPDAAALTDWARRTAGTVPTLRPAEDSQVTAALTDVASLSAYFAIEVAPPDDDWRPLTDLFTDPDILTGRITDVADRLGTAERRVAASILFQGMAARLWSPALGAASVHGLLPDLAPDRLHWRPADTGPLPLRDPSPSGWTTDDPDRARTYLYETVVDGLLRPLADAVRRTTTIAPGLLWGNAASALAGTVRTITRERPGRTAPAVALGRALLDLGVLKGTGDLRGQAPDSPFFVRRSCCLYYRIPGGGKCGDCALLDSDARLTNGAP
ncbi:ATP-binding cassette domain-containing protein [Actinomadura keratinilytica]|uniref:ABC transporter domain-containing protein n=1 Tax=Actinomadura keratinilytica TaxID=547461 RepID=A0ABP7YK94_9ACTN